MGAKMPEEFKMSVLAIYPNETGGGEVRFSLERPMSSESVELNVPYLGDEGMDAGIKEAAGYLAEFAEQLAKSAKAMAE